MKRIIFSLFSVVMLVMMMLPATSPPAGGGTAKWMADYMDRANHRP